MVRPLERNSALPLRHCKQLTPACWDQSSIWFRGEGPTRTDMDPTDTMKTIRDLNTCRRITLVTPISCPPILKGNPTMTLVRQYTSVKRRDRVKKLGAKL